MFLTISLLAAIQQGVAVRDSLTLEDALELARERRGAVTAMAAQVDERRAQRRLAARPANPTAEVSSVDVAPERRLVISQSLAALGRLPFETSAASRLVDAARADSAQRMANLERDVARAYFGAVAAERRARVMGELASIADSLSQLAARRANAGDISDLDRAQFALEATRARLQLSRADELRAARRAMLARELSVGVDSLPRIADPLDAGLTDAALPGAAPATSINVGDVPEVQRARAAARGAAIAERSMRWARLPIPSLVMQRDWSRTPGTPSSTRLGLAIPVPLFSQGNELLDVRAAQARAAEAQAREVELDVTRLLTEGRSRLDETARRARLANDALVPGVTQLRQGAVRLYEAGRTSVLQVLEALRAERDAQLTALDEMLAFQEARADLAALAGRSSSLSRR